jgi:branched-chain amino acid aminotransferase
VVIPRLEGLGDPRALVPLRAAVSSYVRAGAAALDPRVKSANYVTSVLAYLEVAQHGADLAVLRDDRGFVAEGQTMNLFSVRDGAVRTPAEGSALAGITRAYVLQVVRELGYGCAETPLTVYDLECADEVFATSSMRGIMPVSSVNGLELALAAPGPITTAVNEAYVESAWRTAPLVPPTP